MLPQRTREGRSSTPAPLQIDWDLQTLAGITRPEFNWKPLLTEPAISAEPLAHFIPHDQHSVFFSSRDGFQRFMTELSDFGLPLLHTCQVMGEIADWPNKYFSHVRARVTQKGYEMLLDLPANRLLGGGISAVEEVFTAEVAWRNLAILNEWYRLHPQRDPVEVHRELYGVGLQAPDGTGYRWNDEDRTMESLSYGHPTRSKAGPRLPRALGRVELSQFGLTFENDGIRARTQLDWRPNH